MASGSDLTLLGSADGAAAGSQNLFVMGSGGDLEFAGPVGDGTAPLNDLTISDIRDLRFGNAVQLTGNLTQTTGSGTTSFAAASVVDAGGTVNVANQAIAVAGSITGAGAVGLAALETAGTTDHVVLSATATVTSLNSTVTLTAGDNITVPAGSTLTALNGTITLQSADTAADAAGSIYLASRRSGCSTGILHRGGSERRVQCETG